VAAFLREPRMARVATVNADGSPHVVPMWYALHDGGFAFTTRRGRRTARNLLRDPRLTFVIDDDALPRYRAVVVDGEGRLAPDRAAEVACAVSRRYLGPDHGARYAQYMLAQHDRTAIVVTPVRVRHWGIAQPDTVARLLAGEPL